MPIEIGGTTDTVTDKVVCPKCKREAGFKPEDLLHVLIQGDIKCQFCGEVVVSSRPEVRPPYVYTSAGRNYSEWDGD